MRIRRTFARRWLPPLGLLPLAVCSAKLSLAQGQPAIDPGTRLILERLDRLEQENRALEAEVRALRSELEAQGALAKAAAPAQAGDAVPATPEAGAAQGAGAPEAPIEERVAVLEQRTADLAETKVETDHKLPVSLTGLVLFNAFLNGGYSGGSEYPLVAAAEEGPSGTGATLSQSIVGLTYQGPRILGGGLVNGQVQMDFWGGTSSSLNHLVRLRVASASIDWKNQSMTVGQDKPIISPRDPSSLAQVAFAPLTYAGNPWRWQPQIRFEQRFSLGEDAGIRARVGVYQTAEVAPANLSASTIGLSPARPAAEGRFEYWRKFGDNARIEIAPGFHVSETHVLGTSVSSNLFTLDWLLQPLAKVQLTGMFFTGQNAAGIGTLPIGFNVFASGVRPVGTAGGWSQLSYLATPRLTFNLYGGLEDLNAANLLAGQIARNFQYAANALYKLGSNVVLGIEASQMRTTYLQQSVRLVNHYDVALGYLF